MRTFQHTVVDAPGNHVTVHIGQADGRVQIVVHNHLAGEQITLDVPADATYEFDPPHETPETPDPAGVETRPGRARGPGQPLGEGGQPGPRNQPSTGVSTTPEGHPEDGQHHG